MRGHTSTIIYYAFGAYIIYPYLEEEEPPRPDFLLEFPPLDFTTFFRSIACSFRFSLFSTTSVIPCTRFSRRFSCSLCRASSAAHSSSSLLYLSRVLRALYIKRYQYKLVLVDTMIYIYVINVLHDFGPVGFLLAKQPVHFEHFSEAGEMTSYLLRRFGLSH